MAKANRSTSSTMTDDEAVKIYRKIRRSPALLTKDMIQDCENTATERDWVRRAMWFLLAMSGKDLIEKIRTDRRAAEGFAELYKAIPEYTKNLKEIVRFAECAEARIMVALAVRECMQPILAGEPEAREAA